MKKQMIFAYGSNLNCKDLQEYCTRKGLGPTNMKKICNATLAGYTLAWSFYSQNRGCGVLNIEEKECAKVLGAVLEVDANTLSILDGKEGHPNHYQRIPVNVLSDEGITIKAFAYKASPTFITTAFYPSKEYLEIVANGMRENGLDENYIEDFFRATPCQHVPNVSDQARKIAIYSGKGVGKKTLKTWCNLFENHEIGNLTILYSHRFTREELGGFDLVILPGGSGQGICAGLGDMGKENLRQYLKSGGNLLGVCAGAFAISSHKQEYLGVSPVLIQDILHWKRGEKELSICFTSKGKEICGITNETTLISAIYHNGPVIKSIEPNGASNLRVLAKFHEELVHPEGEVGVMVGSPAIWSNSYGKGMVVGVSPHFERTEGKEHIVARLIGAIINGNNSMYLCV